MQYTIWRFTCDASNLLMASAYLNVIPGTWKNMSKKIQMIVTTTWNSAHTFVIDNPLIKGQEYIKLTKTGSWISHLFMPDSKYSVRASHYQTKYSVLCLGPSWHLLFVVVKVIWGCYSFSQLIYPLTPRGNQHVTSPNNIHKLFSKQ